MTDSPQKPSKRPRQKRERQPPDKAGLASAFIVYFFCFPALLVSLIIFGLRPLWEWVQRSLDASSTGQIILVAIPTIPVVLVVTGYLYFLQYMSAEEHEDVWWYFKKGLPWLLGVEAALYIIYAALHLANPPDNSIRTEVLIETLWRHTVILSNLVWVVPLMVIWGGWKILYGLYLGIRSVFAIFIKPPAST